MIMLLFFSFILSPTVLVSHGNIYQRMVYEDLTERSVQVTLEPKTTETKADSVPVKGIYSLMKANAPVQPSVLELSFVEGISIRVFWKDIEPEEEKFDWNYIDNVIRKAEKANKKAMLRIIPGIRSPEWIYNKRGVGALEFKDIKQYHTTYGKVVKMPVPWDSVYLEEWIKFVRKVGERYGKSSSLVMVHMAGPTAFNAEMHLPKKGEGKTLIEGAGYSKHKIVSAWRMVIDAYSNAFPGKALALNTAVPLREDGALEEIIQYGLSRVGKLFYIQGNWLSAYTTDSYYSHNVILDFRKKGVDNVGFQMLGSSEFKAEQQGPLDVAVQKGLNAGAKYFEIYQEDITKANNSQFLTELDKKLVGNQEKLR